MIPSECWMKVSLVVRYASHQYISPRTSLLLRYILLFFQLTRDSFSAASLLITSTLCQQFESLKNAKKSFTWNVKVVFWKLKKKQSEGSSFFAEDGGTSRKNVKDSFAWRFSVLFLEESSHDVLSLILGWQKQLSSAVLAKFLHSYFPLNSLCLDFYPAVRQGCISGLTNAPGSGLERGGCTDCSSSSGSGGGSCSFLPASMGRWA